MGGNRLVGIMSTCIKHESMMMVSIFRRFLIRTMLLTGHVQNTSMETNNSQKMSPVQINAPHSGRTSLKQEMISCC